MIVSSEALPRMTPDEFLAYEQEQQNDRGDKRMAYFSLPTLREYVLIAQDRIRVDAYRRNGQESSERLELAGDVLRLDSFDFTITLSDLYEFKV